MTSVLETCRHRFVFDSEASEVICDRGCGWVIPVFSRAQYEDTHEGRKLSSPSVRNHNLGSDQDQVIKDLRNGGVNEDGKEIYLLSGGLRFFGHGSSSKDEDFIEELSNRLHGKVSNSDLAAIAAIYRKVLRKLEREKREKALQALNQITGEPPN